MKLIVKITFTFCLFILAVGCGDNSLKKKDPFGENNYRFIKEVKDTSRGIWTKFYQNAYDKKFRMDKSYYPSGKLKDVFYFKDNLPYGEVKCYYETGEIMATASYANGLLNGEMKSFYENGKVMCIKVYKEGELMVMTQYDTTGVIIP
jgi:antitoxin component YwqK of YwqJK toxin-antitoxin module